MNKPLHRRAWWGFAAPPDHALLPEGALPLATSPADVIDRLDRILARSMAERSRLGLFAALYRHVAVSVESSLVRGNFAHPVLMARLDVDFFNRYLVALERYREKQHIPHCWQVAFDAAHLDWAGLSLVQHLALGMNAHINFDLALSAAATLPEERMASFRADFDHMNVLLSGLLARVTHRLGRVSPAYRTVDRALGRADDDLIRFSMRKAREFAWNRAFEALPLSMNARERLARNTDAIVEQLQHGVRQPPAPFSWGVALVARAETKCVRAQLETLQQIDPS